MAEEMPIFTRTFDFLTWLLPVTNHFPRAHRHTFTHRLVDAVFDFRERLEEANQRNITLLASLSPRRKDAKENNI